MRLMQIGRRRRFALTIGAALLVASCNEQGELYPRPQTEIRDLLRTVDVPLYIFGSSADTKVEIDGADPARIVWKVTADDHPLLAFSAIMVPDGEASTRVVVEIEGASTGKLKGMKPLLEKEREIRDLYLVSMVEAVDSTLDGRAYDITATYPALMTATAASAGRLFPLPSDPAFESRKGS